MMPGTQDHSGLVLRFFKPVGKRLNVDRKAGVNPLHTQENRERNDDKTVLILAENAADFLYGPDYDEFFICNADRFSHRLFTKEQLLHQGVPDQTDAGTVVRLRGSKIA